MVVSHYHCYGSSYYPYIQQVDGVAHYHRHWLRCMGSRMLDDNSSDSGASPSAW